MGTEKNIREWRAEEIAKLFLLKSDFKLFIETYPTPLFDFLVVLKETPNIKFAVEVKTTRLFEAKTKHQLAVLKSYRDVNLIDIPVFIFKIDETKEKGEFDFLVFPSFEEKRLLIRTNFNFEILNNSNFSKKIQSVIKWYERNNNDA